MLSNRKNIKVHKSRRENRRGRQNLQWASIIKKFLFWVFVLGFLWVGIWTVIFSPVMQVQQINIANNRINKQAIESRIKEKLSGHIASIIPKDNLLLIPQNKIEDDLKQQFKLIRNVTVSRVFPKAILVEIEERSSMLVWCHTGDCYLVDETGTAFYKLRPIDEELQDEAIVKIEDRSQNVITLGNKIIDEDSVQYYLALPGKMQQLGITLEHQFSTPSFMAGEIRVRTKDGWEIILNVAEPLENQIQTLRQVLDERVGKDQISQLEYVDLRLKGRVVYKLKDMEKSDEEGDPENKDESEQRDKKIEDKEKTDKNT